ncbi:MAG: hypothetical protein HOO89_12270 [Ferruginibacter sp.]|nr:hypothetical protein [Ferruginibacter sp.]
MYKIFANFLSFIIIFFLLFGCKTSNNTFTVSRNSIDSTVKNVIQSHHKNCNCKGDVSTYYNFKTFRKYSYSFQPVYIKNIDSVNIYDDSKKILKGLIQLDPHYGDFKRFFLEYYTFKENDSLSYKMVGTFYHMEGYCDGFIKGISAEALQKNTYNLSDRKKLCEFNNK